MKRFSIILVALFSLTIGFMACGGSEATATEAAAPSALNGEIKIDATKSSVAWKGEILGMKSHEGTIGVTEANLTMKDGMVAGGKFVVDMKTINPTDSGYDAEHPKEGLVGHLSSPDFFDVANNPTATFEITGAEGNKVMGNLTLRGKTNPETVENVQVTSNEAGSVVTGTLTFDRQKYGVAFTGPAKDVIISNNVPLTISLAVAQ